MGRAGQGEQVDLVVWPGATAPCASSRTGWRGAVFPGDCCLNRALLARNLDIPLEEAAAVEVAFGGHTRAIDLIALVVDDRQVEHFAVMAGVGVDAVIMDETDEELKAKTVGGGVLRGDTQGTGTSPDPHETVQLDRRRPVRRRAMVCMIGNVAELRGRSLADPERETRRRPTRSLHRFSAYVLALGEAGVTMLTRRASPRRSGRSAQRNQRADPVEEKGELSTRRRRRRRPSNFYASIVEKALVVAVQQPDADSDAS